MEQSGLEPKQEYPDILPRKKNRKMQSSMSGSKKNTARQMAMFQLQSDRYFNEEKML